MTVEEAEALLFQNFPGGSNGAKAVATLIDARRDYERGFEGRGERLEHLERRVKKARHILRHEATSPENWRRAIDVLDGRKNR